MAEPEASPQGGLGGIVGSVKQAFDSVIKTMSETGGVEKDDVTKAFKAISDKGFASVNAMKDLTPGHGQHILRGDEVHKITKSREIVVGADDLLHVLGKQVEEIEQDAIFLYNGSRYQDTKLEEKWVVLGERKCYVMGESEDNFFGKHDQHAPETFEWKHSESSFVANLTETCYYGWSFYAQKTEIGLVDNDLSLTGLSYDKLHVKAEELVSGIKEMLEDEAALEFVEAPEAASVAFMFATQMLTAGVGAAVEAKNWIGEKAGEGWSFMKAHPIESTVIGVGTAALAVGAFFVGPEDLAAEPALVAGTVEAGAATEGALSTAGTAIRGAASAVGDWWEGLGSGMGSPAYAQ